MRKMTLLFLFFTTVFAKIEISSFESDFKQTVKDETGKTIKYFGKLYFKKPLKVLWKYKKPIKKEIYIVDDRVVIIEPELEQITITHFGETKNIIDILNKAKYVDKNRYEAIYHKQKFYIFLDDKKKLKKIRFKDKLENEVEIIFLKPKQNIDLDDSIFKYKTDPSFDIVVQ